MTIGVQNIAYFPYYDLTDGNLDSFAERIFYDFGTETGMTIKLVVLPIKRLEHEFFVNKSIDFMFPANSRWFTKYGDKVHYSDKISDVISGTMVSQQNANIKPKRFKSLSVPFGFNPVKWQPIFKEHKIRVFDVPNAESALKMVLTGRATGADVEYNVARHYLRHWNKSDELTLGTELPLLTIDFRLASISYPDVIVRLNEYLLNNSEQVESWKRELDIIENIE